MTWQTKQKLLKRAITLQTQNRLVATVGQGCDRHLFALMCTSMQQGMDMPKIFQDKVRFCINVIYLLILYHQCLGDEILFYRPLSALREMVLDAPSHEF